MKLSYKNKCNICNKKLKKLSTKLLLKISKKIIKINYAKCDYCDYAQTLNMPSSKLLIEYYKNNNQLRRKITSKEEIYHIKKQIDFFKNYLSINNFKNLEIGPNMGHFLITLRKKFKKNKFYYSELNEYANKYLKTLNFIEHKKHKVNSIILLHVFEHVQNPIKFLKHLKKFLLNEGIIFIEVPDYSVKDKLNCDPFQFEHLSYFSLQSLLKITKKAGFVIEAVERDITKNYSTTPGRVIRLILKKYTRKCLSSTWNSISNQNTKKLLMISQLIKKLKKSNLKIAVYGAGTITQQVDSLYNLNGMIKVIYDNDKKKIGKTIFNAPIIKPDKIKNKDFDKIIILVLGYKKEVINHLLSKKINKNKILTPL